jgi:hypothetical protein
MAKLKCANPCGSVARVQRQIAGHKDRPQLLPKRRGESDAAYAKRVLKRTKKGGCMVKIKGSNKMKGALKGKPGNRFVKSTC